MPTIQVPPGHPKTLAVVFLALPLCPWMGGGEYLDRDRADRCVGEAAAEARDPLEAVVGGLWAMPDPGADQLPGRVASEPDREDGEQGFAERLVRDFLQCALLVCELAAGACGHLECEQADDRVDECPRDEPCTREHLECRRSDEAIAGVAGCAERADRA
jgi:hypothetical protein